MKKLVLEGVNTLVVRDGATPVPTESEETVQVEIAGLGGSEYLALANPGIRCLPNAMAHGIVGRASSGRRVAVYPLMGCEQCDYCLSGMVQLCNEWSMIGVHSDGGFSQQLALPKNSLIDIPSSLSWEQSAFIEPFANSVNAVEIAGVTQDTSVGVIGLGGLGLGAVAACSKLGCDIIHSVDPSRSRTRAAQELGSQCLEYLEEGAFDVVFDTVGTKESRATALRATRKLGCCVLLGFSSPKYEFEASAFIRSQKRMIGSFAFSKDQFVSAILLAGMTKSKWVKSLSFDEVMGQLQDFSRGEFEVIKAVLRPNQGATPTDN